MWPTEADSYCFAGLHNGLQRDAWFIEIYVSRYCRFQSSPYQIRLYSVTFHIWRFKTSLHLLINHLLLPQSRHPNSFLDLNSKALSQSIKQPQRLQAISQSHLLSCVLVYMASAAVFLALLFLAQLQMFTIQLYNSKYKVYTVIKLLKSQCLHNNSVLRYSHA